MPVCTGRWQASRLTSGAGMFQRQPGTIFGAAGNALFDEIHAFDTIVDIRINGVRFLKRFARLKGGELCPAEGIGSNQ